VLAAGAGFFRYFFLANLAATSKNSKHYTKQIEYREGQHEQPHINRVTGRCNHRRQDSNHDKGDTPLFNQTASRYDPQFGEDKDDQRRFKTKSRPKTKGWSQS
jgi:hypothetical protein